jgi:hypothetical protein
LKEEMAMATKFARGLLVGGQSLMAKSCGDAPPGNPLYSLQYAPTRQWNINPTTGALAQMTPDMDGVSGTLHSFVPTLADLLLYAIPDLKNVVVGDIAVGGLKFSDYATDGAYEAWIPAMLGYFRQQGVAVDIVAWGMGEGDAFYSSTYQQVVDGVTGVVARFRDNGFAGPIVFSKETVTGNGAPNETVRSAVAAAIAACPNTVVGPDIDATLTPADRAADGTHPTYVGAAKLVWAWWPFLYGRWNA